MRDPARFEFSPAGETSESSTTGSRAEDKDGGRRNPSRSLSSSANGRPIGRDRMGTTTSEGGKAGSSGDMEPQQEPPYSQLGPPKDLHMAGRAQTKSRHRRTKGGRQLHSKSQTIDHQHNFLSPSGPIPVPSLACRIGKNRCEKDGILTMHDPLSAR
jgi:hypothetical protein